MIGTKRGTHSAEGSGLGGTAVGVKQKQVDVPIVAPVTAAAAAAWSGYGTALKPAWEPVILACKMVDGTIAENALKHGTGGLAIDASRLSTKAASFVDNRLDKVQQNAFGKYGTADFDGSNGRWPANVLLSHSPGCVQTGKMCIRDRHEREIGCV